MAAEPPAACVDHHSRILSPEDMTAVWRYLCAHLIPEPETVRRPGAVHRTDTPPSCRGRLALTLHPGTHTVPETKTVVNITSHSQRPPSRHSQVGSMMQTLCTRQMTDPVRATYDAPFRDDTYCAGPRVMPSLVPTSPDDPATEANRAAWAALCASPTPMLVAFSDSDPITAPMAALFEQQMRGAQGHRLSRNRGRRPFPPGRRR